MHPTARRCLLSAAVAAALVALLAWWGQASWGDLLAAVRSLSWTTWGTAAAIHAGIYLVRAERWRVLLPPDPDSPASGPGNARPGRLAVVAVSAAHNLASYVLPAKSGEVTLVGYLAARGVGARRALAALFVARVLDLAGLALWLGASALWLARFEAERTPDWILPVAAGLLVLGVALVLAAARGERFVALAAWCGRLLLIDRTALGRRGLERSRELGSALTRAASGAHFWVAALLTAAQWFGIFSFYLVLARGTGLAVVGGLPEAAFGSSLAVFTNLLPINAFAGFGTQETGWVLGFGLLGTPREAALASGLGAHCVQLVDVCLFGVLGHLALGLLPSARDGRASRSTAG